MPLKLTVAFREAGLGVGWAPWRGGGYLPNANANAETTPAGAPAAGRQKAATRRNMRREERVTVQSPLKKQQPDGMSHRGYLPLFQCITAPAPRSLSPTIPLQVPSWFEVAGTELCRFFYVYQLMMIWTYYYWAYWQVAVPFSCLVALSALLSMAVQRHNAASLAQLTRTGTKVTACRSGKWEADQDSASLVPGDVIRIGGNGCALEGSAGEGAPGKVSPYCPPLPPFSQEGTLRSV